MTIERNGCTVRVFKTEINGWCFTVGANVYFGFKTRRAAIASIEKAIG